MMNPFIVAEIGASHNGVFMTAKELVRAAAAAGADAVKFQTFTPEQMVEPGEVAQAGPWAGMNLLELYRRAHTPRNWHAELFRTAKEEGIIAFSSVFHRDDVDFLETLGCPMYKIASFEITDLDLIRHAASKGNPVVISTGMATWPEISSALLAGGKDVTLLKCTSAYPADVRDVNLLAGQAMASACVSPAPKWGLSDHTLGLSVPVAATALGAAMIEKHITLRRANGLDDGFASEPHEFAAMVKACREAAEALGEVRYGPSPSEISSLQFRRQPGGKRGHLT